MDPLLDEKIVLTLSRVCTEFFKENLYLSADKEAYGPSRNEGLCYESCSQIGFKGDVNGRLYFCMDGYTKLKLLPRIAERYGINAGLKGMAESVLLEFSNQLASNVVEELRDGGFDVELEPPENLSHKLVPIDLARYRQYILIFFMRDRRERSYKGRVYLILTMQKFAGEAADYSAPGAASEFSGEPLYEADADPDGDASSGDGSDGSGDD
jgi:CheY-specific phosphatase CheX